MVLTRRGTNSMHCGRFLRPLSRREMLRTCAGGFGAVALAALAAEESADADPGGARRGSPDPADTPDRRSPNPADPGHLRRLHHPARARNVIFLYMDGGPSQV